MRKTILLFLAVLLLNGKLFAQSGWTVYNTGTTITLRGIYFNNSYTGWVCGGVPGIILKTTNGGINWFTQFGPTGEQISYITFVNDSIGYAVGGNNYGLILKTTNGGNNWFSQNGPAYDRLYYTQFLNVSTGYVIGTTATIMKTTNGGNLWNLLSPGTSAWLSFGYFINVNTGWAGGQGGTIVKTTNAGTDWFFQNSGTSDWIGPFFFCDSNTGYFSAGNSIYKTIDAGNNWLLNYTYSNCVGGLFFLNNNTGYCCGCSGTIITTTNAGNNWSLESPVTSSSLETIHFPNSTVGYICAADGTILKKYLNVPALISPQNASTVNTLTPTLVWTNVQSTLYYNVQVSTAPSFNTITDSATVTSTQRTIPSGKLLNNLTYFWRVNATSSTGTGPWSSVWYFSVVTIDIKKISENVPNKFKLYTNYPNPFNPVTNIRFDIPKLSNINLDIFNIKGQKITTLLNKSLSAGSYSVSFNASNLSSGIYFYRMKCSDFEATKSFVLIK